MNIFDEVIKVDTEGNIKYAGWVEWKHISMGFMHCAVCFALDECWFNNFLKPQIPQHEKCHCVTSSISQPIANVNAKAVCDIKKFKDYIFGEKYAWNGKRKLFEVLGFKKEDSEYLKKNMKNKQ